MKKRVFIIHGWEGTPDSNWFPWLKKELEIRNFDVKVPEMPNTANPMMSEWLSHLQKLVGEPDKNTYLIGHSLGVIAILRYLESLKKDQKIGGAILVAGFPESIGIPEIDNFFSKPVDFEKVKTSVNHIIAINSDNDPYVPLEQGQTLKEKLDAELIVMPNSAHLNQDAGFTELPIVLEKLLEISNR